jgi:hypothetical protein
MQRSFSVAFGIMIFLASVGFLRAQEGGITVSGNVYDKSGAVVPGATLEIKIEKCKCSDCKNPTRCDCCPDQVKKESNAEGHYSFTVPHGTYLVDAYAPGLKVERVPLDLREGNALTYDFHLAPSVQQQ